MPVKAEDDGFLSLEDYYGFYGDLSYEIDGEHSDRELTKVEMELIGTYLSGVETAVHLCCGAGRHVAAFGRLGILSIGVDLSPALVAVGNSILRRERLRPSTLLVVGNVLRLPIASGCVDCVTIVGNSFSLLAADEGERVFGEMARILRTRGIVILDIPLADHIVASLRHSRRETCRRVPTRSLGEVEIVWARELDQQSRSIRSVETYLFWDNSGYRQVKKVQFVFHLYRAEEIRVMAAAAGFELVGMVEHKDVSGRYLGMLSRRLFLIMRAKG